MEPKKILIWLGVIIGAIVALSNLRAIITYFKNIISPPPPTNNGTVVNPSTGTVIDPKTKDIKFAVNLKDLAYSLYDDLHSLNSYTWLSSKQQDRVVSNLLKISKPVQIFLSNEYQQLEGNPNLYTDVKKQLSTSNFQKVKHLF